MNRLIVAALAASTLTAAAIPAAAQNWRTINQRQATFVSRIEQGVRNGALTRAEANRLRGEFNALAALEGTYRRSGGGLNAAERADLDRKMDALSRRIFVNKHDRQNRR